LYTLTEVTALVIASARFLAFLRNRPGAALALHRSLSARLREADLARAAAGAESVPQRLAELLLSLGERYGRPDGKGGRLIGLPLSQDDLAGLILTSRRTVGRILKQWRKGSLVVTGRRSILVKDVNELRRRATGPPP
jgi:CRP-like cAMP-binding protein